MSLNDENSAVRTTIVRTPSFVAEHCSLPFRQTHQGYSPDAQIVVSYRGAFRWCVGSDCRLVDANSALRVFAGQEFYADHPIEGVGHGNLIITPSPAVIEELFGTSDWPTICRPLDYAARLHLHALLRSSGSDLLYLSEKCLALLMGIAAAPECAAIPNRAIVEQAKAILHENRTQALSLDSIAKLIGVSPIYLTQQFKRSEGVPLHQYLQRLRFARALNEIPDCDDLTGLALDLGFYSHSHFTTSFKAAFGMTPSEFRSAFRFAPPS